MRTKLIQVGIYGVFVICAGVAANATVYTFQPQTGEWSNPDNWYPPGRPGYGDTAIIPAGKTCIISQSDAEITTLELGSLAVVRVENRILSVGPDEGQITLNNGALWFLGMDGQLRVGRVNVSGTGLIYTDAGIPAKVTIQPISTEVEGHLTLGQGVEMLACATIRVHLKNDGRILADASNRCVFVGAEENQTPLRISGSGQFRASGLCAPQGVLRFGRCQTDPQTPFQGLWEAGPLGRIEVLAEAESGWKGCAHNVRVSEGVLQFDASFATSGHLDYRGGLIKVISGKTAAFSVAPSD